MRKIILSVALICLYSYTNGQIPIGDPFWFTDGVLAGADSSFKVNEDGTIRINDLEYTWPSADAAGQLTSDGSGTLTWEAASGGVTGLDSNLILYGANAGGIEQDSFLYISDYLGYGIGKGVNISDTDLSFLRIHSDADGILSELLFEGKENIIRWNGGDGTGNHWWMRYLDSNGKLGIYNTTSAEDFELYGGSSVVIYSDTLVRLFDSDGGNAFEIDDHSIRVEGGNSKQ